jgi:hypothetical protein
VAERDGSIAAVASLNSNGDGDGGGGGDGEKGLWSSLLKLLFNCEWPNLQAVPTHVQPNDSDMPVLLSKTFCSCGLLCAHKGGGGGGSHYLLLC